MSQTTRVKIRTCIRENTFRYQIDPKTFPLIWKCLESRFGLSIVFGVPNLMQIETKTFLLRSCISNATITLIKKPFCDEIFLTEFHNIIHFEVST